MGEDSAAVDGEGGGFGGTVAVAPAPDVCFLLPVGGARQLGERRSRGKEGEGREGTYNQPEEAL